MFNPSNDVQDAKKRIYACEQSGDYGQALDLARKTQKFFFNNSSDEASITVIILQLEKNFLELVIFFSKIALQVSLFMYHNDS
ncbi:hypothetical protein [Cardinium endosymbiont of Nabis limbatus]|uniref:hypothetical protein n=1 Tax=Cardinium endosymbiont of Nabis limbatus TaxID=3066217 RepID=UPI003AF3D522